MWDCLLNASAITGLRTAQTAFLFLEDAVDEVANGAAAYEWQVPWTARRYGAAALVLGVAVLQRVAEANPPLMATAGDELCQEPTLGRLLEALSVPVADLLPERAHRSGIPNGREDTARPWAKVRDGVDDGMDLVLEFSADEDAAHLRTKDEAAGCLLTQHGPPHTDPVYEGVLEPPLRLAEEVPSCDITRIIAKGRPRRASGLRWRRAGELPGEVPPSGSPSDVVRTVGCWVNPADSMSCSRGGHRSHTPAATEPIRSLELRPRRRATGR
ncbi:hypothetical protein N4G70_33645 [Streptomyces sp. ASQP_92]|uniref:hypothetical protein n=1 Tax=Streptomyces sp. ASQP_92 TaxID=2979116 RepID=UPI0021C1E922|nr:hypothetical protein [Streptomyces sp. ASQP_92]MCT9093774.1 hypothetical protein [Streptomyces sp. ASQP_92]